MPAIDYIQYRRPGGKQDQRAVLDDQHDVKSALAPLAAASNGYPRLLSGSGLKDQSRPAYRFDADDAADKARQMPQ